MSAASTEVPLPRMRWTYVDVPTRSIANVSENPLQGGCDVNRVNVPPKHRGQGIGSRLLDELLADADAHGVTLWLDINPYGQMTYEQLEAWYMRRGFVPHEGRYRRLPRPC